MIARYFNCTPQQDHTYNLSPPYIEPRAQSYISRKRRNSIRLDDTPKDVERLELSRAPGGFHLSIGTVSIYGHCHQLDWTIRRQGVSSACIQLDHRQ